MKKILLTFVALIGISKSNCQTPIIDYLGQTPPGDSAVIFAAGVISKTGRFEHAAIFSRDGKEFYFSETPSDWVFRNTMVRKYINNVWTVEKITSFSNRHIGGESTISYTNDSLVYTDINGTDLWMVTRNDSDWNEPNKLPDVINSFDVQWHPSISSNGNIYFSSKGNIYRSIKKDNVYQTHELIPAPVNSSDWDADAVIAADESYIIFNSNRVGGYGDADLYISYQNNDGSWTNPKNLGSKINSEKMDDASSVSPDGKYLFFSRRTNEESDIYWVSSGFIDSLKTHTTSIKQIYEQNIPVYPNPTKDKINIAFGSLQYKTAIVEITDITGKLISSDTFRNLSIATVDFKNNPKGIYILNLSIDGIKLNKKISIE
jgi:hypothetical protein